MQSIRGLSNNNSNSECDCYLGTSHRVQRCPLKKKICKIVQTIDKLRDKEGQGSK